MEKFIYRLAIKRENVKNVIAVLAHLSFMPTDGDFCQHGQSSYYSSGKFVKHYTINHVMNIQTQYGFKKQCEEMGKKRAFSLFFSQ